MKNKKKIKGVTTDVIEIIPEEAVKLTPPTQGESLLNTVIKELEILKAEKKKLEDSETQLLDLSSKYKTEIAELKNELTYALKASLIWKTSSQELQESLDELQKEYEEGKVKIKNLINRGFFERLFNTI